MRLSPSAGRNRRGIASLEFVLVFPFLLILVSVLFIVGRADVAKVQTVTGTRNQTWANRPGPKGSPLNWPHNPMDSQLSRTATQPVSLAPVIARQTQQAQSQVTLVANPWAFQSVPFPSANEHVLPHTSVLSMLPSPAGPVLANTLVGLDQGLPDGPALSMAASLIGSTVNPSLLLAALPIITNPFSAYFGYNLLEAAQGNGGD